MKHIQRSALLPYAQTELFAMVADVERYPEFLPQLETVELLPASARFPDAALVEARVQLKVAGIRESFITRNHMHPPGRIDLELIEGPFDVFAGFWEFTALGQASADANASANAGADASAIVGSKVALDLRFELTRSNPIVRRTYGALIERATAKLVEAFCQRATVVCTPP